MHYRTPAISFLEPIDGFLAAVKGEVVALDRSSFDTADVAPEGGRIIRRAGASHVTGPLAK